VLPVLLALLLGDLPDLGRGCRAWIVPGHDGPRRRGRHLWRL